MFNLILFLICNFLIVFSFYLLLTRYQVKPFSFKLMSIGLLFFTQIIMTLQITGILGILTSPWVIGVNFLISGFVIFIAMCKFDWHKQIRADRALMQLAWPELSSFWNRPLIVFCLIAFAWLVTAVYFLPPRGVDDLSYHLPRLYEYWQRHRIELLPVSLSPWFAFPENADLLSLWSIIFFHDQRWVDGTQVVYGVFGILCVYVLARMRRITQRDSMFLGLMFFLCPLVLNQMGTNYIDIITTVTIIVALVFSLRFQQQKDDFSLYGAAISMGLLIGMKYTMLIFVAYLQILIVPVLFHKKPIYWVGYILIVLLPCFYWYERNIIGIGELFYPMSLLQGNMDASKEMSVGFVNNFFAWGHILWEKFRLLALEDTWLTTFNGGMGAAFWCLAFPAWYLAFPRAWWKFQKGNWIRLYIWFLVPIALALLIPRPVNELSNDIRYALIIVPIGLIFLGELLKGIQRKNIISIWVKLLCVFFSFLGFLTLPGSIHPSYRFDYVLNDLRNRQYTSEFRYFQNAGFVKPLLRFAADPIEAMTKGNPVGLSVWVATDNFVTASTVYGTKFQNKVLNFEPWMKDKADAYLFFELNQYSQENRVFRNKIFNNPDFLMISQCAHMALFISRKALGQYDRIKRLLFFYKKTFPDEIPVVKSLLNLAVDSAYPIVTTDPRIGPALRYLQLKGGIKNPVIWGETHSTRELLNRNPGKHVYMLQYHDDEIELFESWK